jgi:putative protein-disulfide isomerase
MPLIASYMLPLLMLAHFPQDTAKKGKIIYVYDPLCGWCYGFSPVIQQLRESHGAAYDFEVISGGMVTGNRVRPFREMAEYISQAYPRLNAMTGARFSDTFLNGLLWDSTAMLNSMPGSVALSVFKSIRPQEAVAFAGALQTSLYQGANAPEQWDQYAEIARRFGLDGEDFLVKMRDPASAQMAQADFRRAEQLGVSGFPAVLLEKPDGQIVPLSNGWVPYSELVEKLLREN